MESQIYADRVDFGRVKDIMNAQEKMQNKKGKKLFSKIKKQMKQIKDPNQVEPSMTNKTSTLQQKYDLSQKAILPLDQNEFRVERAQDVSVL